ncbi:MAG: hypothetical protein ACFB0C_16240 [Leptolyngbyaceae cyanobacterium]
MVHANWGRFSQPLSSIDPDQIQLALAIADDGILRSLLTESTPAISRSQQLGQTQVTVGVPLADDTTMIDAVVAYESLKCALLDESPPPEHTAQVRCQSGLQTLGWRVNIAEAIALLSHGGFQEHHIQRILHLPSQGWHRSWWSTFDRQGNLGHPFQRWFRCRSYGDGTYILQYRDHYAQVAPPCFRGTWHQVPVVIASPEQGFGQLLMTLRRAQASLKTDHGILLSAPLNELEREGFMRQGISVYALGNQSLGTQASLPGVMQGQAPTQQQRSNVSP